MKDKGHLVQVFEELLDLLEALVQSVEIRHGAARHFDRCYSLSCLLLHLCQQLVQRAGNDPTGFFAYTIQVNAFIALDNAQAT
jgi:hypothetical protein